ncbi:hypothetical protein D5R81_11530 [Parashewanella spongiae]|uniref:Lactonase family protein n=1 Tax=Parashewanella spongiae TaxID=342950 RepID=A0A3A6TXF5_9GAMM|nr:beta-propeller fold lactonase family protein [Parashewanella spongiae]MCL1079434.1 lactonase family protein [Parashewanella spongiae]RJY13201.1 hypothetical protein D5R81_11530 [Parashewanella spongiae]
MKNRTEHVSQGWKVLILGCLALLVTACGSGNSNTVSPTNPTKPGGGSENSNNGNNGSPISGYLYTTTNGEADNLVLRLTRHEDGSLTDETKYETNGIGDANRGAGGDAHGDFDSQGAVQIVGDYLLAVNAGDDSISVFSIDKSNGDLTIMGNNVSSGGQRPVSIAAVKKSGEADKYWVVVANQWDNPNVQKGGDGETSAEFYPSPEFFSPLHNLIAIHSTDEERNITLFSFDASEGKLTEERVLDKYRREHGGPASITFSDDGTKLAVSTWGIAHLHTATPLLTNESGNMKYQRRSRVYVYNFNKSTGKTAHRRQFDQSGISGTIGINWARSNDSIVYASNFNLTNDMKNNGLTVLKDAGNVVYKAQNFKTGPENVVDEACWTVLNPEGSRLYVSSFGSNSITAFSLNSDGSVKQNLAVELRGDAVPAGDSKDMYITSDNKYLYNLGAFNTFSMNTFEITDTGLTYKSQYQFNETKDEQGNAGAYNFLGLAGFDVQSAN